jgi:hypothetical protein
LIALDLPAQRLTRRKDMLLSDIFFECGGAHSLGQRPLGILGRAG